MLYSVSAQAEIPEQKHTSHSRLRVRDRTIELEEASLIS